MDIEIINLYSNVAAPGSDLISDHGQSFLMKMDDERILLDTGASGKVLLHNMRSLGIDPDEITYLIFSHGHYDHTRGLPRFLDARTKTGPLPVLAHPDVQEPKRAKLFFIEKQIGFPELTEDQKAKVTFDFDSSPHEINRVLRTTGEIRDRKERDGTEPTAQHLKNGKFEADPVYDDVNLILDTNEGQVIITGCAHAGILNICNYAKKTSDKPIKAIIGGTHMVRYSKAEVLATADKFEKEYDFPDLYLNHCTDKLSFKFIKKTNTIDILRARFGEEKVKNCFAGTKLQFTA
ncbi:MAG: MBL fold metallo-hydrolase [Candidatus Odinarchaeota archaeon]